MVEDIDGLPAGALGARIWGEVTREDYDERLLPPVLAAVAAGGPIRYLLQVGPGFTGVAPGSTWDDARTGLLELGEETAWERTAVVTEIDWILGAVHLFAFMIPGEVQTFRYEEAGDAVAWLAD